MPAKPDQGIDHCGPPQRRSPTRFPADVSDVRYKPKITKKKERKNHEQCRHNKAVLLRFISCSPEYGGYLLYISRLCQYLCTYVPMVPPVEPKSATIR